MVESDWLSLLKLGQQILSVESLQSEVSSSGHCDSQ